MATSVDQQIKKSVLRACEDLGSLVSLKVAILLRYEEWDQLADCKVDPRHYLGAESYWRDAMAVSILRKTEDLPTTIDRKLVAEESFLTCEEECLRTNRRLFPYLGALHGSDTYADNEPGVFSYIMRARKIAADLLGPCPDTCHTIATREGGEKYAVEGRFGPGATFADRGLYTTMPDKMSSSPTLTSDAVYYSFPWGDTMWAQACNTSGRKIAFVPGNRFTTVPKDCKKDRGIAVEPSINLFYQLGYGRVIRHRLKAAGIDLPNGQDLHRRLACDASIKGHLATLDLSNASDTVSRNLVRLLLPPQWFSVLDDLRSKKTEFRGGWRVLEKFSSMGNGFTFELETLIFLCLILALSDPPQGERDLLQAGVNVFVFGDDIIIPTEYSDDVTSCLSFFGLTVNREKSFVSGPFRESCGGDYFEGVDVRPYFLKEFPREPQQLISMANGLRRACKGNGERSNVLRRSWFSVLDALPSHIRNLRGPEGLGDLCVHDDAESWRFRWRWSVRQFRVYQPVYRKIDWNNWKPDVVLAAAVYGHDSGSRDAMPNERPPSRRELAGGVTPRNGVTGYKIGWAAFS